MRGRASYAQLLLLLVPKLAKWDTTISKSTCNKGSKPGAILFESPQRPRSLGRARCTSARSVAVGAHFLSSTFRDFVTPTSLVLGLVSGCTWLNAPDPPLSIDGQAVAGSSSPDTGHQIPIDVPPIPPFDAGDGGGNIEAGIDGSNPQVDSGRDARWDSDEEDDDAEVEVGPAPPREECLKPGDEDGNGLSDCADFACASLARCCAEGTLDVDERWDEGVDERWNPLPLTGELNPPRIEDGQIIEFGDDGQPRALMRNTCTPLALGIDIEARLTATGQGGRFCPEDGECFAGVVLTAALDSLPGSQLKEDLSVKLTSSGCIRVTSAGITILETSPFAADHELLVRVSVIPTADRVGSLRASVSVQDLDNLGVAEEILHEYTFLQQSELITDVQGCSPIPGLMLAIEGLGDSVTASRVSATTKRCVNPSQFYRPASEDDLTITAQRLNFGWANGHISAPSLISSPSQDGERWDVMVEATNAACELETWTHVGYSLGHAYTQDWENADWSGSSGPKLGSDPPSCIGQGPDCQSGTSLREPSIWGFTTDQLEMIYFVYARQQSVLQNGEPVRYVIYGNVNVPTEPFTERQEAILTPDDLAAFDLQCDSLRDPNLIVRNPETDDEGFFLFFTCESDSEPKRIYAVRLSVGLTLLGELQPILSPHELSDYAGGGVWAPEVAVSRNSESDKALYRIWFMARSANGSTTGIAMAQGEANGYQLPDIFVPYQANPVLTQESAVLGPCNGICTLFGIGVSQRNSDPTWYRMVVARRSVHSDSTLSELLVLDQFWNSP